MFVIPIYAGVCLLFVSWLLFVLLESGGTLTRRGAMLERVAFSMVMLSGACMVLAMYMMITD
jgi:hypothetical protein